jgi:hypothetical protein
MLEAASSYPLADALWTMVVFFAWVIWLWLLFVIFADLFSRKDIGGWGKAGWVLLILVLPFLGVLIYLIAESSAMADRRLAQAKASQEGFDKYVKSVASTGSPTDQISHAKDLLDSGAITADEFQTIKSKALASS